MKIETKINLSNGLDSVLDFKRDLLLFLEHEHRTLQQDTIYLRGVKARTQALHSMAKIKGLHQTLNEWRFVDDEGNQL